MDPGVQGERVLFQLPIRIGRNALNHCQIVHNYISDFHATIESVDGQLCVRDLNSRNGAAAPSGDRFPPNVPIPLAPTHNAFILGRFLHVHVEVFEQQRAVGERMSETSGSVLGNRAALQAGANIRSPDRDAGPSDPRYQVAPLPPLSADGGAMVARPSFVPGGGHDPWAGGNAAGQSHNHGLPALSPLGGQRDPGGYAAPYPSGTPAHDIPGVGRSTQHLSMGLETMALLGLRELAGSLVPGAALQTTGDVARLLTKLHDTVEVFCRCFVPMREGYAQFVSQMDLRRAASQRSVNRSGSALEVEVARDPAGVARALLDWRNQDYDAPDVIEGIFADLMIHQLALLEGVMRGVQALLEELSPEKIEGLLRDQPPPGVSAMLGRYRALWKTFRIHYDELANQTRTFEVVFGSDFAASYREYLSRVKKTTP
jgi:type VI secretion system protein ImpI